MEWKVNRMAKKAKIFSSTDNDIATLSISLRELDVIMERYGKLEKLVKSNPGSKKVNLLVSDNEKISEDARKKLKGKVLEVIFD